MNLYRYAMFIARTCRGSFVGNVLFANPQMRIRAPRCRSVSRRHTINKKCIADKKNWWKRIGLSTPSFNIN